jgi:hypothetical protein
MIIDQDVCRKSECKWFDKKFDICQLCEVAYDLKMMHGIQFDDEIPKKCEYVLEMVVARQETA